MSLSRRRAPFIKANEVEFKDGKASFGRCGVLNRCTMTRGVEIDGETIQYVQCDNSAQPYKRTTQKYSGDLEAAVAWVNFGKEAKNQESIYKIPKNTSGQELPMKVIVDLKNVNNADGIIAPIAHFDGKEIEVMTEEDMINWAGDNEDRNFLHSCIDWDVYSYVLPINDSDCYSFKKEWVREPIFGLKEAVDSLDESKKSISPSVG